METISIPPFYIGQEVVAIDTQAPFYHKGDEFKVQEIGKTRCCKRWYIYTGYKGHNLAPGTYCRTCQKANAHPTKLVFPAKDFVPKHNLGTFISMKKVADKSLETVGAN